MMHSKKIVKAEKDINKKNELKKYYDEFVKNVETTFKKEFYYSDGVVGSISELYDSKRPYKAKGAPAQAWSVAEVFRIIINGKK